MAHTTHSCTGFLPRGVTRRGLLARKERDFADKICRPRGRIAACAGRASRHKLRRFETSHGVPKAIIVGRTAPGTALQDIEI
jgi:hypothetical protein